MTAFRKVISKFLLKYQLNTIIGSLLMLSMAGVAAYSIWEHSYLSWTMMSSELPEDNNTIITWFQHKQSPIIKRLDMGDYQNIPNISQNNTKYDKILQKISSAHGVDCTIAKAVMFAESRGIAKARSNRGAIGLMQLMPMTAKAMGVTGDLYKPENSILAGVKYLRHLVSTACYESSSNEVCDTNKDIKYLFAAYNSGSKANRPGWGLCSQTTRWECLDYDGYFETRVYVNRVKANYNLMKDEDWGC